jgi:hypothetical protein
MYLGIQMCITFNYGQFWEARFLTIDTTLQTLAGHRTVFGVARHWGQGQVLFRIFFINAGNSKNCPYTL